VELTKPCFSGELPTNLQVRKRLQTAPVLIGLGVMVSKVTTGGGCVLAGLKQVRGRANYRAFTEKHAELFGGRIDFEAEPELLGTPRYAVCSALWFWRANGLFVLADAGINRAAADSIPAIINPGTNSYDQRWENVRDLDATAIFASICSFSVARPRFEDAE
jgi:hypothetical protein